ncbi:MAG: GtrA family protein [Vibrio fluvialis]
MSYPLLAHFWQLNRFAMVGVLATTLHLSVVRIGYWLANGVSEYEINAIGFLIAFVSSYLGHRYFTFAQKGSFFKFLVVALIGFGVNNVILASLLKEGQLMGWGAVMISTISAPVMTFTLSKCWAFK